MQWVGEHAAEPGADPSRIAVAGDSAGGNRSAVVAQLARDNGAPALAFQLLWYWSTGADLTSQSFRENADGPILTRDVIKAFVTKDGHVKSPDSREPAGGVTVPSSVTSGKS